MVHAMGKAAAARITLRSVEELEALAAKVPPMAYDIDSYASLGLLWRTLPVETVEVPSTADLVRVRTCLGEALADILGGPRDLGGRLGAANREASARVRRLLREQWWFRSEPWSSRTAHSGAPAGDGSLLIRCVAGQGRNPMTCSWAWRRRICRRMLRPGSARH